MFNGDHELAIVAGLRAGCLGHYVSNKQRKTERRKAILRFVIDARAHGRLTQAAVYALELREQTQVVCFLITLLSSD